ncbi:hypothetical protein TBK1r_42710 [Stieleria magnilauensis]|uniref:Acyltransferase family protein n=1 Tax=Stieleria magnilauensis TaxID=2527963 RepID=A0ABX5XUN0_9BACT|nr:hypothetical protein TBK1r_42710 [Planctomycetes bacterium TBK1r]
MQFLGRTSYVTYLLHWVAIELALFGLLQVAPNMNNRFLLAVYCTLIVYPITYVASDLIHRYLELPVIRWAKRGSRASTSKLNSPLVAARP